MKNKVLIKLIVPELDINYDVFIPVNEIVWKVKLLLLRSVEDLLKVPANKGNEYYLVNKNSCKIYDNNEVVVNTDIRNGSELLMLSIPK